MPGLVDASVHSAFSRPLKVEEVPPEGMVVTISATEAELRAIAAQDGLEGLAKLEGALHINPWHRGGLAVTGEMRAGVTQICVVTLEAFDSEIVEPIDVKFAAAAAPDLPPTVAGRLKRAPRSRSARPAGCWTAPNPRASRCSCLFSAVPGRNRRGLDGTAAQELHG